MYKSLICAAFTSAILFGVFGSNAFAANAGTIQFASDSYDAYETAGSVTLTVLLNRTGNTNAPVSVHYQTMPGSANASRFTPVSGVLNFAAGSPVATITVAINNDTIVEPPQSFTVVLSEPVNATLDPKRSTATVTIQDDDGINTIQFEQATYGGVDEGFGNRLSITDGSVEIRVHATRGADPNQTLTAELVFEDETATYGTDYIYAGQCSQQPVLVTFSPGVSTQSVVVTLINPDPNVNKNPPCGTARPQPGVRTFRVRLANPTNFTTIGQQGSARVTIFRNAGEPNTVQFVTSATSIREGGQASVALHVVRYGAFSFKTTGTTIQYTTEVRPGDTAVSGVNFLPTTSSLTFEPIHDANRNVIGAEHDAFIVIPLPDNASVQGDLTFHVTIASADNAQLGDNSTIKVTVVDDDLGNTAQFVSATYTASESAGNAVLTVQLTQNGDPSRAATVDYIATPITAFAGFDFSPIKGTLIFAPYETTKTILVPIFDDNIAEHNEAFRVSLLDPGSGTLIGPQSNTIVTIVDNDIPKPTPTPTAVPTATPSPSPSSVGFATRGYNPSSTDTSVKLTVDLQRGYPDPGVVTVHFATADGTAIAGTDYVAQNGTIMFPAGQNQQTITVPLIPHSGTPGNRTFTVSLSSPSGAQLTGIRTATVTIFNPNNSTKLLNISTRGPVEAGDEAMIAGFIIQGSQPTALVLRGIGPSLSSLGVAGALADPSLTLFDTNGTILAFNDNYGTNSAADLATLRTNMLTPNDAKEAAIVRTLTPGSYTTVLRGTTNGVGLVETFDISPTAGANLVNISTRGKVEQDDNGALIAGFIIGAPPNQLGSAQKVVIRAIGPSLEAAGVTTALSDTTLDLYRGSDLILSNDNWTSNSTADQQALQALGVAPTSDNESALITNLDPGSYSIVIRGKNNTTGVALAEVYQVNQ